MAEQGYFRQFNGTHGDLQSLIGNRLRIDCSIALSKADINGVPRFDKKGEVVPDSRGLEFEVDEVGQSNRHGLYMIATSQDDRRLAVAFCLPYGNPPPEDDSAVIEAIHIKHWGT